MALVPASEPQVTGLRNARFLALVALLFLGGGLVAIIVATTPWQPLPAGESTVSPAADFSREQMARSHRFYTALRPLSYGSLVTGVLLLAVLGLTPLGKRLVGAVARPCPGSAVCTIALGVLAVSLLHRLVLLPFDVRAEMLLRDVGLSTQRWPAWLADLGKGFGLETGLAMLALLGLYGLMRWLPRLWWAPAAAGAFLLVVVVSFAYPVLVEPVFNSFRPMQQGQLRSDLLTLARDDGVPVQRVLVADASRRTTAINAYVSGFGSTRRIVVYDTLLESSSPREVKLMVAHELGHAEHHDVLRGTLVGALGAATGVCLLYLVGTGAPVQRRAGITSLGDPRSLALILLLCALFSTASMPVQNLISRKIEARSDVHALNLTRDATAHARMQRQLAIDNLAELAPGPVSYYLYASHPTAPERIALARAWARTHGEPAPPPLASAR